MRLKYFSLALLILSGVACKKTSPIPECNPQEGRFIKGRHYISGNMLTEDNNWNLIALQKYFNRREKMYPDSNCIEIMDEETFEETLRKKIEDIDYQGRISH